MQGVIARAGTEVGAITKHANFDKKLLAYAAAAGGAILAGQQAQAVVVVEQLNLDVPTNGSLPLDIDHNGVDDFLFSRNSSPIGAFSGVTGINSPDNQIVGFTFNDVELGDIPKASLLPASTILPNDLELGQQFQQSGKFAEKFLGIGPYGEWEGQSGFLGLRFEDTANVLHYGFVQLSVGGLSNDFATHLHAVAYETADGSEGFAPIHVENITGAGATPEPASLGLLAMGATGLMMMRRRRG